MRESFKQGMEEYGKLAKEELELRRAQEAAVEAAAAEEESGPESGVREIRSEAAQAAELQDEATGADGLRERLDAMLRLQARMAGTDAPVQERLYAAQLAKQEIMEQLRRDLRDMDDETAVEDVPPGATPVYRRGNHLRYKDMRGKEAKITFGDILTDGAWGLEYALDKKTVPRVMRKRLIVERAKRQLEELWDEQIMTEGLGSARTPDAVKDAYAAMQERHDTSKEGLGSIAERIVAQTARKMTIDEVDGFRFQRADAFQDAERSIDFILRRTDHGRGVKVEEGVVEGKGVQVTIQSDPEKLRSKQYGIERSKKRLRDSDHIDDIAMTRVDAAVIAKAYDEWKKVRTPGGPDKLLPREFRKRLFDELTKGMAGTDVGADNRENKKAA